MMFSDVFLSLEGGFFFEFLKKHRCNDVSCSNLSIDSTPISRLWIHIFYVCLVWHEKN